MSMTNGDNIGKMFLNEQVQSIFIGSSSRQLCSGGDSGVVRVWDLKDREVTHNFRVCIWNGCSHHQNRVTKKSLPALHLVMGNNMLPALIPVEPFSFIIF